MCTQYFNCHVIQFVNQELELNRVTLPLSTEDTDTPAAAAGQTKSYDLHMADKFWASHRGSPFPTVADAVQTEVNDYRAREEEVTRLRSAMVRQEWMIHSTVLL